uniref:F-box domain-containing protein n=1 Tax=Panagrellus redivivus TaxID=6233 RepID=A0A7E4VYI9_PANRE
MPYPIIKLPYGLRCRLSKLVTPVERYEFQIAAGNAPVCPPKLQLIHGSYGDPRFICNNGTISVYRDYQAFNTDALVVIDNDILVRFEGRTHLRGFELQDLTSETFGHILFDNIVSLFLLNCSISKSFYQTLKTNFPKFKELSIENNTNREYTINLKDVLFTLPHLRDLNIACYTSNNWITELLQLENHSLKTFDIYFEQIGQFEPFNLDDLWKFLKAQKPGFLFTISIYDELGKHDVFVSEMRKYLNENFVEGDAAENDCAYLTFIYMTDYFAWHLPLDDGLIVLV